MSVSKLSTALARIVGAPYASRTEGLKRVWAYVKDHNLQNPDNKGEFKPDAALYDVFKQDSVYVTQVMKLLSPHYEEKYKVVKAKKVKPVVTKTVTVSPQLQSVTGPIESHTDGLKKVWNYIKAHNLQSAVTGDKKSIMCDAKLQALFNKPSFAQTEILGMIGKHFSVHTTTTEAEELPVSYVRV